MSKLVVVVHLPKGSPSEIEKLKEDITRCAADNVNLIFTDEGSQAGTNGPYKVKDEQLEISAPTLEEAAKLFEIVSNKYYECTITAK